MCPSKSTAYCMSVLSCDTYLLLGVLLCSIAEYLHLVWKICTSQSFFKVKAFLSLYRYDPNVELPMDVDTEQDRVLFIKAVAQFMVCILDTKALNKFLNEKDATSKASKYSLQAKDTMSPMTATYMPYKLCTFLRPCLH